jgi:hypothetical protein
MRCRFNLYRKHHENSILRAFYCLLINRPPVNMETPYNCLLIQYGGSIFKNMGYGIWSSHCVTEQALSLLASRCLKVTSRPSNFSGSSLPVFSSGHFSGTGCSSFLLFNPSLFAPPVFEVLVACNTPHRFFLAGLL